MLGRNIHDDDPQSSDSLPHLISSNQHWECTPTQSWGAIPEAPKPLLHSHGTWLLINPCFNPFPSVYYYYYFDETIHKIFWSYLCHICIMWFISIFIFIFFHLLSSVWSLLNFFYLQLDWGQCWVKIMISKSSEDECLWLISSDKTSS